MSQPPSDRSAPAPRAFWVAAALASVALVVALWVVPYLPTNDGPEHVLLGIVENHYDDPGTAYSHYLRPAPQFAGRGFAALFVPLEAVLPWRDSLRAAQSLGLLAWAWGFVLLVRAVAPPRRAWVGLAGFVCAFQWSFYMGFFPFVFASALTFYALALSVDLAGATRVRVLAVFALVLTQAFMHAFAAVLTVVALAALAAFAPRRRLAFVRLGLVGAPALVVLAAASRDQPAGQQAAFSHDLSWLPLRMWLHDLPMYLLPGSRVRGLVVLALAVTGVASLAARARRSDPHLSPVERGLGLAAAAFLLVGLVAPLHVPGWQFFGPRFLPLGVMLGLAVLPLERVPSIRGLPAALLAAGAAASLLYTSVFHRALGATMADVLDVLASSPRRTGLSLSVPVIPSCRHDASETALASVPLMTPCYHLGPLYAATAGGLPRYMFASSTAGHSFTVRGARPSAPSNEHLYTLGVLSERGLDPARLLLLDEFAAAGISYESIVVVARPRDLERFIERGYRVDRRRGAAMVAHFRGCPAALAIDAGAGREARVEAGWFPLRAPTWAGSMASATAAPEGGLRLPLPGLPCGLAWVRVYWDRDGSGSLTPGDTTCRGADADGKIVMNVGPASGLFRCDPAVPSR